MTEKQNCCGNKKHSSTKIACTLRSGVDLESIRRIASEASRRHGAENVTYENRMFVRIGHGELEAETALSIRKDDEAIQIPMLIKKIQR